MNLAYAVAALAILLVVYALWLRSWLQAQPWAAPFFAWVGPIERALFKKSKTILFARLKIIVGVGLTVLTQMGTLDLTPMMPFIPEQYHGVAQVAFNLLPLLISVMGMADERLRNATTQPIELVALPDDKELPMQVRIAVAEAAMAKETAVAVVKERAS